MAQPITAIPWKTISLPWLQLQVYQSNFDGLANVMDPALIAPLEPQCDGDLDLEFRKALLVQWAINYLATSGSAPVIDFTDCEITLPDPIP